MTAKPTIQYYLSDEKLTEEEAQSDSISWTAYTGAFVLSANSKKIVYAKVTDEAGNTTIVNSAGVVIYTDSTPDKADITYTYKENADKAVTVDLNGNTVAAIKDKDGHALIADSDYSVDTSTGAITSCRIAELRKNLPSATHPRQQHLPLLRSMRLLRERKTVG